MLAARKRLYMSYISLAAIDNIARAELFLFSPLVALFFFFFAFPPFLYSCMALSIIFVSVRSTPYLYHNYHAG